MELDQKRLKVEHLIEKYSMGSKNNNPNFFLSHVDYFKNNHGIISARSISEKWSELSKENRLTTYLKGLAIIQSANASHESVGCPYKFSYKSSKELMPCLKHSRDTGIVNKDGTIDINVLTNVLFTYFETNDCSPEESKLVLSQSKMYEYLEICDTRDKDAPVTGPFFVSYKSVSKGEWGFFFDIFSDIKINSELCVTAETFLLFYFNSKILYDRILKQNK